VVLWKVRQKKANDEIKRFTTTNNVTGVMSERAKNLSMSANNPSNPPETTNKTIGRMPLSEGAVSLPPPWTWKNVGNAAKLKPPLDENGTFTFIGTGKNFSGNTDSFFFTSQPISNSVEFFVRLSKVSLETNTCQCGIMLRESNLPNVPFVFLGISSTNIIWTQRDSSGADCKSEYVSAAKLPIFLRLRRNANFFSGEISINGTDWNLGRTNTVSMTESNYLLGFAVTSGKPALEVKADFDSITNHPIEAKP
jgi:hypothetical protein